MTASRKGLDLRLNESRSHVPIAGNRCRRHTCIAVGLCTSRVRLHASPDCV